MTSQLKRGFGRRINRWLDEPDGAIFKDGKWRFWFPMLIGFSLLNALLTASVFGSGGNLQTYMGGIVLAVGVLLAWLCIGNLHYSDSQDAKMARGVSALDSITLVFVIAHFCFLLWVQGHLWALRASEADYKASATAFNEKAEKISGDNVRIAEAFVKGEKLRNDTAYQERKAAEAGAFARAGGRSGNQSPALSVSPIELEKPEKPKESSIEFLTYWDWWVRMTNFGELALAALTMIYIRNRSAKFNAQYAPTHQPVQMNYRGKRGYVYLPDGRKRVTESTYSPDEVGMVIDADYEFPDEIETNTRRQQKSRADLAQAGKDTSVLATKKDTAKTHVSFDSARLAEGLKRLRESLRDISFRLAGVSFKADVKPEAGCVWIRAMRANQGTQETINSAKAQLSILDDAITMKPDAFRERLETFLKKRGFEI